MSLHLSLLIIWSLSLSRGEWIEIPQSYTNGGFLAPPKAAISPLLSRIDMESRMTEIQKISDNYSESSDSCPPDIHSWTQQTWSTQNTSETEDESEENSERQGAPKTSQGKMIVLHALQDRIVGDIERRIYALSDRESRTSKGMGSMEGALITISLLTFAVYLIKIVMMLINSVQVKKAALMKTGSTVSPGLQTYLMAQPGR